MSLLTDVTVVLLICHFLGDFHFQSQKMAERKLKSNKPLIAHFGIHLATLIVSNIFIFVSDKDNNGNKLTKSIIHIHIQKNVKPTLVARFTM